MARIACLVLFALLSSGSIAAETSPEPEPYTVPCIPTAGIWHVPPGSSPRMIVPDLAVVDTDIRPERARLYLDGRFIGVADDFDGNPDFLYFKPGSFRLESRLGGYAAAVFEIEAEPGCRNRIRHRMERLPGVEKEGRLGQPDHPVPFKRVYAPSVGERGEEGASRGRRPGGADPRLRPDLACRLDSASTAGSEGLAGGALRLQVEPPHASLYLDGGFVATGQDLARMVEPLAVKPGHHLLAVVAPGHEPYEQEIEVDSGEVLDVRVVLEALATGE